VIKGCKIFWGKKLANIAALWAGALLCKKKNSREQNVAGQPAECTSGGDLLFLYKILHLMFFPLV